MLFGIETIQYGIAPAEVVNLTVPELGERKQGKKPPVFGKQSGFFGVKALSAAHIAVQMLQL